MPPDDEPPFSMTPTPSRDPTLDLLLRIGGLLAIAVIAILVLGAAVLFGSSLYRGTTTIPEAVQTQIWVTIAALLTVGSTAIGAWVNSRNANRIRDDAARTALFLQEAAAREAAIGRKRSDENAAKTQVKVQELITDVHNGLKKDIQTGTAALVKENSDHLKSAIVRETSDIVRETAEKTALALQANSTALAAQRAAMQSNVSAESVAAAVAAANASRAATDALAAKFDQFLSRQMAAAAPVPAMTSAAVQAGVTAIETNTAATELVAEQLAKIAENTIAVETNTSSTDRNTEARDPDASSRQPDTGGKP